MNTALCRAKKREVSEQGEGDWGWRNRTSQLGVKGRSCMGATCVIMGDYNNMPICSAYLCKFHELLWRHMNVDMYSTVHREDVTVCFRL